ncbi:hypothetical protein O181_074992 [Austropuccinia psidii MF-1]|uniref:Phosphoglycerate mutase n=1 Tax=Austropuccinia psidii MF-1 TaxID=1389203 RepID=A0A9Q3FE29_9BASI|nr:hypothetical protein [Austropuccinia psidii MF-1]
MFIALGSIGRLPNLAQLLFPLSFTNPLSSRNQVSFEFQSIPGFFLQSDPYTNPDEFDVYGPNSSFGLIERNSSERWRKFQRKIQNLTQNQPTGVNHKVIFIARHGEGFHNVAEAQYGTPLWDCHWSTMMGDGNLTWGPDSRLTNLGRRQVNKARDAWKREISEMIPIPQAFISSPLSRAIETMSITDVWKYSPAAPLVIEHWRENIGLHTCDKRRSKTEILGDFPFVKFEDKFEEDDIYWTKNLQETSAQLNIRIKKALTDVFLDPSTASLTYISITAHSGVISSLLEVTGHRPYPTDTGGMIPLVIRANRISPTRPPAPGPSATKPPCAA